jgi:hypothetical protein
VNIFENISSVEDWEKHAPPQEATQWKDGRSARELAKAWFPVPGQMEIPAEFQVLLDSSPMTAGVSLEKAVPELETRFDDCGGKGHHSDLAVWGKVGLNRVTICVEARTDEEFGPLAGEYVVKRARDKPASRVPERFSLLCEGLMGYQSDVVNRLRYQLFTAVAGTLVEASKYDADIAVLVIHEFLGKTKQELIYRNAEDLNSFVSVLSDGEFESVPWGKLTGPVMVPGGEYIPAGIPLFIGKCSREV